MSLYNALFGVNPLAGVCLQALGITTENVPRFRDAYINETGEIVIHTRTGGGNRDFYDSEARCRAHNPEYFTGDEPPTGPWNTDLRALPGFLYDEDDDFDSTYADFHFKPTPEWEPIIKTLLETTGASEAPRAKWEKVLSDLKSGNAQSDSAKRALAVGEQIIAALDKAQP